MIIIRKDPSGSYLPFLLSKLKIIFCQHLTYMHSFANMKHIVLKHPLVAFCCLTILISLLLRLRLDASTSTCSGNSQCKQPRRKACQHTCICSAKLFQGLITDKVFCIKLMTTCKSRNIMLSTYV